MNENQFIWIGSCVLLSCLNPYFSSNFGPATSIVFILPAGEKMKNLSQYCKTVTGSPKALSASPLVQQEHRGWFGQVPVR